MEIFVARQPIFDTRNEVFGYELLFRSGFQDSFPQVDPDAASAQTFTYSLMDFGLDNLTGGKRAFINFTRNLILSECATLLPRDKVVIEILEDVVPDPEVLAACRRLKQKGYMLALDDYTFQEGLRAYLPFIDVLKIDFAQTQPAQRQRLMRDLGGKGMRFLAEKVETKEGMEEALQLGCSYLQGFYFCRPSVVPGRSIEGFKQNYIRLLQEIHRGEIDYNRLEKLIKSDLSLTYALLKLINSAAFPFARRIESVRQSLVLLGQKNIRKWVTLVTFSQIAQNKPQELVLNSIVRATFCESLGESLGMNGHSDDLFLMGMFSRIDAILDQPLEQALKSLPISEEVKASLLGESNPLNEVMKLAESYEMADWQRFSNLADHTGLPEKNVPNLYKDALKWVNRISQIK